MLNMILNQEHLDLKENFFGADQGFKFLDSFLNKVEKLNNEKNKKLIKIYDYRNNNYINLYCDYEYLYNFLQNDYLEFLIKVKFKNHEWFVSFKKFIYIIFNKDFNHNDVFSDTLIQVFTRAFLYFSTANNIIDFSKFKNFIVTCLYGLTGNFIESVNYTELILNQLFSKNLLSLKNNFISINDNFIYHDFYVTSLQIVPFYSHENFDFKYSCRYCFDTLLPVIDYYLNSIVYTDSFEKTKEIFFLDSKNEKCFSFLMNYEDTDFSKLPILEKPYKDLFDAFLFKKLLLNEYCFHVILMSCFENYYFDYRLKNILMEKADPNLNLRSDVINILTIKAQDVI